MAGKKTKARPVWERGYNGHVLWLGKQQLGKVSVHAGKGAAHRYTWVAAGKAGECDDLDQAREAVEYTVLIAEKQLDLFGSEHGNQGSPVTPS